MTVQLTKGYTIPVNGKNRTFLKLYICHFPEHKADLFHVILWFVFYYITSIVVCQDFFVNSDKADHIYYSTTPACPYGKGEVLPVNSIPDTA